MSSRFHEIPYDDGIVLIEVAEIVAVDLSQQRFSKTTGKASDTGHGIRHQGRIALRSGAMLDVTLYEDQFVALLAALRPVPHQEPPASLVTAADLRKLMPGNRGMRHPDPEDYWPVSHQEPPA